MSTTGQASELDVVGIGNAIVDVIGPAEASVVADAGLDVGAMTLVDATQSDALYAKLGPSVEMSGGSCANSMAALAALGGRAGYIGRVRDDQFGAVFAHDCRASGVVFNNAPATSGSPTARCLVFVHPDAQRTMATYLGACTELGPADLDTALIESARITLLEGYLWDKPDAKAACLKAATHAHRVGRQVALSLSDPFCVDRWRAEFRELVDGHVDLVFANEAEVTSLYEAADFDEALQAIRGKVEVAALTRGPKGCVVLAGDEVHVVDAAEIGRLVDTTGAGDLFAAGFLYGLANGLDVHVSARLGSLSAGLIIQQFGPRAERPLVPLIAQATDRGTPLAVPAA